MAGISAGPQGAYSVALSGGYEDDVDLGYALYVLTTRSNRSLILPDSTYTGSGGRDLKGTPQNRKNVRPCRPSVRAL